MPSYIRGIDHVLVATADLDDAAQTWRRLGFTTTPKGRHVGKSTANYCIMFPNDYVELIGIVDTASPPSQHHELISGRGNGLFANALSPSTAEDARAAVIAAGIEALPLRDLHRTVERPDGPADLYFKNFDLVPEATPDFRIFFCHHLTPAAMRHPAWLAHANGVVGLDGIVVVSAEPERLTEAYGRLFGIANLTMTDTVLAVRVGRHRILFVTEDDLRSIYGGVELPDVDAPAYGAAVAFRVGDLDATRRYLEQAGIPHTAAGNSVLVPPSAATGVLVDFRQAQGG